MEPHSVELCESLFFTARTVTLPLASSSSGFSERIDDEMNPKSKSSSSSSGFSERIDDEMNPKSKSSSSSPALSSSGYSIRICDLMKLMSESRMSKEDVEIEASKSHWTDTVYHTAPMSACPESSDELLEAEKLYKENVEVMKSLQREDVNGGFFEIGGRVLGRKIAEGGQAAIYDGGLMKDGEEGGMVPIVLKVFKGGYSLRDLQKQWPLALFQNYDILTYSYKGFNPILCGRLLEDGRFGFEMMRFWGDLRKFLDVRLINNGNQHPPLMMSNGHYHECCILVMMRLIAEGMEGLHEKGTLHKDLKASNVLVESSNWLGDPSGMKERRLDPLELNHDIFCTIADYECSIGVVGTGFWRAPEVLGAVKNQALHTTPNLFTIETDVYSFAMTCYEILTGLVPFEHSDDYGTRIEDVIEGKRPTLPKHLQPWVKELLHICWHADLLKRPSFKEILETLKEVEDIGLDHIGSSYYYEHYEL